MATRIIVTRECATGQHDKCNPRVEGMARHGYGYHQAYVCGCDCRHGQHGTPGTAAEAYDQGRALHPADLFGGSRRGA